MTITVRNLKRMLPKTYDHRKEVLSEMCTVLSQHQNLQAKVDKFVFNDGTVKNLLSLSGTVTVLHQGKHYNIPVCLWLNESYPRTAPICYVKPTSAMRIVSGRHVSNDGQITLPYLDDWRHTQCDLLSLILVLKTVFSEVPPVCMRLDREDLGLVEKSNVILKREDTVLFFENNETNC